MSAEMQQLRGCWTRCRPQSGDE